MQPGQHHQSLKGSEASVRRISISNVVLCGVVAILAIVVVRKDTTLMIEPPEGYGEAVQIARDAASESFHATWGEYMAVLLGNVTPDNVSHLVEAVRPLLAPEIYQDVTKQLAAEAARLKVEQVTTRFMPNAVRYEAETHRTYVTGEHVTKGIRGSEERELRTYEFHIVVANHRAVFRGITFYAGLPKTDDGKGG